MINLIDWLQFFVKIVVSLAIGKTILIKKKIIISFLDCFYNK